MPLVFAQSLVCIFGRFGLAAMPANGVVQGGRPAVVQVMFRAAQKVRHNARSPQWSGALFETTSIPIGAIVCQAVAHIVQEQIRVEIDGDFAQLRHTIGASLH